MSAQGSAVPLSRRSAVVLGVASLGGLMMLVWPLLLRIQPEERVDPPFLFLALLPVVIAVVLAELSQGGLDTRVLAVLGVLSAVIAILRGISAGTGGIELVFFLLILAGRVFGPGFGFVLGVTALFASALMTAGVGPWLPFQMLVSAWVGMFAGLLPRRVTGRAEIAMLAAYGVVSSYAFGLLMNLSGWPFLLGISIPGHEQTALSFDPQAPLGENLSRFFVYTLITSTGSFDTGRAITTAVAIVVVGPAVLTTLRRAARRATVVGTVERPASAGSAGADHEDLVVVRPRVTPAVAVAGGDPEVAVRSGDDRPHPAVLADEEGLRSAGLLVGDGDPPEPAAAQRAHPERS
jgi:energy-coupling factor transport system substrate-specific component